MYEQECKLLRCINVTEIKWRNKISKKPDLLDAIEKQNEKHTNYLTEEQRLLACNIDR
jgi:hypothetical protein